MTARTDLSDQADADAGALLHVGTEIDAEVASQDTRAFDRWCEEQLIASTSLPGLVSARHFAKHPGHPGVGESPRSLMLYAVDDAAVLTTQAWSAHERALPEALSDRVHSRRSIYRQIGVHAGHEGQRARGPAILHVTVDVAPAWIEEFLKWYAEVHVPAVLDAPGMLGARRYENLELVPGAPLRPGQHTYCTLYEMEDTDVIGRPETLEAAARGACPEALAPHRVAMNHVYEERFRVPS